MSQVIAENQRILVVSDVSDVSEFLHVPKLRMFQTCSIQPCICRFQKWGRIHLFILILSRCFETCPQAVWAHLTGPEKPSRFCSWPRTGMLWSLPAMAYGMPSAMMTLERCPTANYATQRSPHELWKWNGNNWCKLVWEADVFELHTETCQYVLITSLEILSQSTQSHGHIQYVYCIDNDMRIYAYII